jgi:hypothetical protein
MNYIEVQGVELNGRPLVTNARVYNLGNAVRGSKLPMAVDREKPTEDITKMSKKLGSVKTGTGHDCYLKGILVVFDLTMSVKMSVQLQRYHFIDFVSSQSAMHKLSKFELDEQYVKYVDVRMIEIMKEKQAEYNTNPTPEKYLELLYSNPCGFTLTGEMTTNYLQLKTIYQQRKNHRLDEWQALCEWIENLPYFKELVLGEE